MANKIKAPSKLLIALETRALLELGSFFTCLPLLRQCPNGDGHPVLVLPGFMTSDASTRPLRYFLRTKGYQSYGWGLGRNYAKESYKEDLEQLVEQLYQRHGQKVSLVGWSLGGVFARAVANTRSEKIRQVITLGSPFSGLTKGSNADGVYEYVSGRKAGDISPELLEQIEKLPDVPFTAIYTKTDGIVSWKNCIEYNTSYYAQNIEVASSHIGLGHNPTTLFLVADRLSQPENAWRPYMPPNNYQKYLYPNFWRGALRWA